MQRCHRVVHAVSFKVIRCMLLAVLLVSSVGVSENLAADDPEPSPLYQQSLETSIARMQPGYEEQSPAPAQPASGGDTTGTTQLPDSLLTRPDMQPTFIWPTCVWHTCPGWASCSGFPTCSGTCFSATCPGYLTCGSVTCWNLPTCAMTCTGETCLVQPTCIWSTCDWITCSTATCASVPTCGGQTTCSGATCDGGATCGGTTCGFTCSGPTMCGSCPTVFANTCAPFPTCSGATCSGTCDAATCNSTCDAEATCSETCEAHPTCTGPTCGEATCAGPTCDHTCQGPTCEETPTCSAVITCGTHATCGSIATCDGTPTCVARATCHGIGATCDGNGTCDGSPTCDDAPTCPSVATCLGYPTCVVTCTGTPTCTSVATCPPWEVTCNGGGTCPGATTCAGTLTCDATCSGPTCVPTCEGQATCAETCIGKPTCGQTCPGAATCAGMVTCPGAVTCSESVHCSVYSIAIDILPCECPNTINMLHTRTLPPRPPDGGVTRPESEMRAAGADNVIAVAVLGGFDFDVRTLDPQSLFLAGVAPRSHRYADVESPSLLNEDPCECGTGLPDGFEDLILSYPTASLLHALGPLTGMSPMLALAGSQKSGETVVGFDCVDFGMQVITPQSAEREPVVSVANHPNPFNAQTVIAFTITQPGPVRLEVYDVLGRRVVQLLDAYQSVGAHEVVWTGRDALGAPVASGVYLYRFTADGQTLTGKMVLLK